MKKTSHKARRDAQAKTSKKPVALSKPQEQEAAPEPEAIK